MSKLILHLCADIGSDSQPYRDAGYEVICVGEKQDVRRFIPPPAVYGIIANPPCTHLSGSGARWWATKGESALLEAMSIVDACIRVVYVCKPKFWVLENPVGRLNRFLGKPVSTYQPYEYGDTYSKRTCLWGEFTMPKKTPVKPTEKDKIWNMPPSPERSNMRSICSKKFAQAFFEANP